MEQPITSAEANRRFSALLREVRQGRSFLVTTHGRAVARLAPVSSSDDRAGAQLHLLDHLRHQQLTVANWSRDDAYD